MGTTPEPDDEQFRAEAARLRLLDEQTQRDIVEMHRLVARDPKAPLQHREQARRLAAALPRLLGLSVRTGSRRRGV